MEDSGSHNVELYIYDLTSGMAAMMSQLLLGRHIDGIWHTAVVVYGREFFFGGQGIQSCLPVIAIYFCSSINLFNPKFSGEKLTCKLIPFFKLCDGENAFSVVCRLTSILLVLNDENNKSITFFPSLITITYLL